MPDSESGIHRIVPDKGDSPHRRREKVIVLATILLVVIGVLTIMRKGSNAAPSTADTSGSDYSGGPDASGAGGGSYGAQLPGEIGSIPEQTAGLLNTNMANQLANVRGKLANARRTRTHAQNRVKNERKTINRDKGVISRQKAQIQKLEHHPAHTGKKNGVHRAPAKPQPKAHPKAHPAAKSQTIPFGALHKLGG